MRPADKFDGAQGSNEGCESSVHNLDDDHTPGNTALEDMLKSSKCPLVAEFLCWLDS